MRELELEFRYLCLMEAEAKRSRTAWLETLAQDLKQHLYEFYEALKVEQASAVC